MLKSLLNKVKSERQKSQNLQSINIKQQKQENPIYLIQGQIKLPTTNIHVESIKIIRYFVLDNLADIKNQVLSCTISHFNQLTYAKRKVKEIDLKTQAFPPYLNQIKQLLKQQLSNYNHILINVYPPGIGIMPHFDGPLYRSKVVVLSLGGPSIINFSDSYKNDDKICKLLLQDKSIHIFQEESYEKYLHGIQNYQIDSIFFRIQKKENDNKIELTNSSIDNFKLTKLYCIVLRKLQQKVILQDMDLSQQMKNQCWLIPISNNIDYNYKIEIVRKERISITIRQKYT